MLRTYRTCGNPVAWKNWPNRPNHVVQRNRGMLQIFRFNWPWYASALAMPLLLLFALRFTTIPPSLVWIGFLAASGALFWAVISLCVSHWVYDLSPLREWSWISTVIANHPGKVVNIHAGF